MRLGTIAFLFGIVAFQQLSTLPDSTYLLLFPFLLFAFILKSTFIRLVLLFVLGGCWSLLYLSVFATEQLPVELERQDLVIEGRISGLPNVDERRVKFLFLLDSAEYQGEPVTFPKKIQLSWYSRDRPLLISGEVWRLTVRLKRPYGFMNPGGFDYEGWLFQQGIKAVGYVRGHPGKDGKGNSRLIAASGWGVDPLRQRLASQIKEALQGSPYTGIISALSIGDRSAISVDHWDLLRDSATNHLMAISGLHIGLIATLAFFIMRRLWCVSSYLVLRCPAQLAAAVAAIIAALMYAALAGFSIPTQRALIMVVVVMSAVLSRKQVAPSRVLAIAALLVVLWDPLSVLSAGFWLSFLAVAVILLGMANRVGRNGFWWRWGRVQFLIAVGLIPPLVFFFQQLSLVGPLANLVAVPWVAMLVVPTTLLGVCLLLIYPPLGAWVLQLCDLLLSMLFSVLLSLTEWQGEVWLQHQPPLWSLVPAVLGVIWLLLPRGFPSRWLGLVLLLPLFLVKEPTPEWGSAHFTLLDVGQGLAAVIQTQNHTLLYDTGPSFGGKFNSGDAVVVPYLQQLGIQQLDSLILSHGDRDHIGGMQAVLQQLDVQQLLAGQPQRGAVQAGRCLAGQQWQWDGVQFRFLYPFEQSQQGYSRGNDDSCVLQVKAADKTVLMTGDIEKYAEQQLVHRYADQLQAEVLVAPHHGSRTSSTQAFVQAVNAQYVLFPVGHLNRYGFPKPEVVARYKKQGAELLNVSAMGAITFILDDREFLPAPQRYRQQAKRYWHQ